MGCWSAPQTVEQALEIEALMARPLNPKTATNELYHLVGDDGLFDDIDNAADRGETDVRCTLITFLQGWFGKRGDDAEVLEAVGFSERFSPESLTVIKRILTCWDSKMENALNQ